MSTDSSNIRQSPAFLKTLSGISRSFLAHNHPSGDPTPSNADINQTESLQQALDVLDITLMDHIILSDNCYFSFTENKKHKYDKKLLEELLH